MPTLLWVAAALSLFTAALHTFAGGAAVARPLLNDTTLPPASKWLNYYCWHITTVLLVFLAGGLALAAYDPAWRPVAIFLVPLCLVLGGLSSWVATKGQIAPLRFPSTSLFLAIAGVAAAGLWL